MTSAGRAQLRWQSSTALAIYFAAAVFLLDRGLAGHPGYYVGRDTDPPQTMWFFNWWRFAIAHRLNPSSPIWCGRRWESTWRGPTLVPLPAVISIPLQVTVGEPATYNIVISLAIPIAAFSAFLLCRRVTGAFWPSVLGGYIFGFSSYMLGEVLAHLDLVAVFPVPLIALLTLKRLDGEISARRFAIGLAALLTVEFLFFPELFATITLAGGVSLLLALMLFGGDARMRLSNLIAPAVAGYLIASVVLSPYLYYLLALGFPHGPIWSPANFSADLLNYFIPTPTNLLGTVWIRAGRHGTPLAGTFMRTQPTSEFPCSS